MKIAILGFAGQGQSAYDYWGKDHEITICDLDQSLALPDGVSSQLGPDYLSNLDQFDMLIRTPALHPQDIASANGPAILDKVSTVTNEFFRVCPSTNIIGVTGTKGKGTTSTLIARMLQESGYRVHLGGNIGIPPLDMLKDNILPEDWIVLELANFQLIDLRYSPHIAVCVMVVEEHLNWHIDMEEYTNAKKNMFAHQSADDMAIYYSKNAVSVSVAEPGKGKKIPYFDDPGAIIKDASIVISGQTLCPVSEVNLLGAHNLQNICAAVTAVWQITQDVQAISQVIRSFTGLPHRLELVGDIGGIKYYDDSFGTTPETAIVALEAFSQPKVVILGGSDKGATYDSLALSVKNNNVRDVVLIGDTGPAIETSLRNVGFTDIVHGGDSMNDIVENARKIAQPGDVVLLSTGCASFGLFQNYKDRGEQFKSAVLALS